MKTTRSILSTCILPLALIASALPAPAVWAHGGEDHGDVPHNVVTSQALAPRTEAKSEDVELLAVYDNKELTLYISRFATNEPITGAQIDIESGSQKAVAKPAGEGVYKVSAPWLAQPGKHGLVATIQGKDITDLLEASLEVAPAPQAASSDRIAAIAPAATLGALGGAVLIGLAVFGLRRRKK